MERCYNKTKRYDGCRVSFLLFPIIIIYFILNLWFNAVAKHYSTIRVITPLEDITYFSSCYNAAVHCFQ